MAVADFLSDEGMSVTADDGVAYTLLNDVTRVILISCDVLLAAADVLVSMVVGEVTVDELALEEISVCVVVACLNSEDDTNPKGKKNYKTHFIVALSI